MAHPGEVLSRLSGCAACERPLSATRFPRRAAWGIGDQIFSSVTNFAVGIYVASQASTLAFGAFSLAFIAYLLLLNLGRSVVSQPLLIRHSNKTAAGWSDAAGRGVGVALMIGVAAGVLCVTLGLVVEGHLGAAFLGLGLTLPGLLLQDAWRFAFFAAGRDRDAVINDAVWAAVVFPIFAVLIVLRSESVFAAVFGWGFAATVAALVGVAQAGVRPQFQQPRGWFEQHTDLIPRFVAETVARSGAVQLVYYLIGLISGIVAVGTIRAAELIVVGPFNVLFQGVNLITLPEAARRLATSRSALLRFCRLLAVGMVTGAVAWGIVCLIFIEPVGRMVLGDSWDPAQTVLLPIAVALGGLVSGSGAFVGLRVLGAADQILRVALLSASTTLAATSVGAWVGDANGAAWAMAGASWFGSGCAWLALQSTPHDASAL